MRFVFVDNAQQIRQKLNEAMIQKLYGVFYSEESRKAINQIVGKFVKTFIASSKVWQSLSGGDAEGLDKHFGIPQGEVANRLKELLDIWASQIIVESESIKRQSQRFTLSYKFSAIYANWADVLESPAGITINTSRAHPEGQRLHWLSWLLVEGDQLKIDGYHIKFGPNARSRSGNAIMTPKFEWRIPNPDEFGPFNPDNNFITRQLALIAKDSSFRNTLTEAMISIFGAGGTRQRAIKAAKDIEL